MDCSRALATLTVLAIMTAERPGVLPDTPWSCPSTHPIKGYVSVESGRRVYHVPGGRFYEEASPERCYAARRTRCATAADPRAHRVHAGRTTI